MNNSTAGSNPFRLDGAIIAITGGARGIGRTVAEVFMAAGGTAILLDKDIQAVEQTASEIGACAFELDVTDEKAVVRTFDVIQKTHGRLDVLINNAGCAIRRPSLDLSTTDWQKVMDVNVTVVFLCAREAARIMVPRKSGAIVNIASIFGISGGGLYPNISYQTSKGAVVNMTRALAIEWAAHGLRVNAVAPTWVDTEFIAALKEDPEFTSRVKQITPLGRTAQPAEVACACLFLASAAASMVTGHVLPVDGGFLAQ